jgi:HEAT repeat protein
MVQMPTFRLFFALALTLLPQLSAAQPTVARDRAPAVPNSIRPFVDRLYSPDPKQRADAACEIGRRRQDAATAIPILLTMLHDDVAVSAIDCNMSDWLRRQIGISADAVKWSETSPAKEAADTLGDIGEAAVAGLLQALNNADWRIRKFAAYGLGEAEPQADRATAVAALGNRLTTDAHADVRERSAWALGEIEDAAAVDALTAALRGDADRRVRATAAWALGEIEHPSAVPGLIAALDDSDIELRKKAAWALGEIESATAVEGLVKALKDADPGVRREAAWALGEIESGSAVNGLGAALSDPDVRVRRQAAWALGEIEDASATPGLIGALKDTEISVRKEAAWALGEIEATGAAVAALIDSLKDADWQVRKMAAWALGEIEDASALEALQAARYDANVEVRRAVVDAIRELRNR